MLLVFGVIQVDRTDVHDHRLLNVRDNNLQRSRQIWSTIYFLNRSSKNIQQKLAPLLAVLLDRV